VEGPSSRPSDVTKDVEAQLGTPQSERATDARLPVSPFYGPRKLNASLTCCTSRKAMIQERIEGDNHVAVVVSTGFREEAFADQ
jgi:hypothetical protein